MGIFCQPNLSPVAQLSKSTASLQLSVAHQQLSLKITALSPIAIVIFNRFQSVIVYILNKTVDESGLFIVCSTLFYSLLFQAVVKDYSVLLTNRSLSNSTSNIN